MLALSSESLIPKQNYENSMTAKNVDENQENG